jgi:hypothetical protein
MSETKGDKTIKRNLILSNLTSKKMLATDPTGKVISGSDSFAPIGVSLNDGQALDLPDATSGFAWVMIGERTAWAQFNFVNDGTVEILNDSGNVQTTDSAGALCVISSGTQVSIKNNLGSTLFLKGVMVA